MDEVVATSLEEIALEGREGCTVPQLWSVLEQKLPVSNITQLTAEIKHYLWACLLLRTEDVQLFQDIEIEPTAATNNLVQPKRGKKTKLESQPTSKKEFLDPTLYPNYEDADTAGVKLLASETVRMGVLGLYDALHCRFALSEPQLKTLEMIAKKRTLGVLQSVLASQMQITNSNFFYVVKCLEERGLIARTPVMVSSHRSMATVLTTNVLHLQRFAPAVRLGPYQVFKMVEVPGGGQQQLDMDTATYTIQDDARLMRLICERIGSTEDRSVIESELKVVLGFSGKRGHRTWRRLRQKLIKAGQIESFAGEINGKTVMCLRLLKDFKMPGEDGDEDDGDQDKKEAAGSLLVEVSIERQVLEAVLAAGEEGVLNTQLFTQLGLNHKRSGALLSELVKKYGLTVTVVTVNKAIHNRIQAPRHLIDQYRRANALLHYQEGELPALPGPEGHDQGATPGPLLALPAPPGPGPSVVRAGSVPPSLALSPGNMTDGVSPRAAASGRMPPLKEIASGATAVTTMDIAQPGGGGGGCAVEGSHTAAVAAAGGGGGPAAVLQAQPQPAPTYRALRQQRVTTDLSDDRLRRLLDRLDQQGYIVAYEIRGMLYRYEVEHGLLPASTSLWQKGPDKKTINRLLARMEATGRAKQITITVPGSYTNGELRTMGVVVPVTFQATEDNVKEIQDYFAGIERRARSASTKNYFAARAAIMQTASVARQSQNTAGGSESGQDAINTTVDANTSSGQLALPGIPSVLSLPRAPPGGGTAGLLASMQARQRLGSLNQPVSRLLPEGTNMRAVRAELAMQESSKRGVGALSHKQLFGSSAVSLRSLTAIVKPGLGVVERMPDSMTVLMGGAYQGEAVFSRMLLNGFNWCKMVRARLLHYFICRCVGLGGFAHEPATYGGAAGGNAAADPAASGLQPYYGATLHPALQACKPPPSVDRTLLLGATQPQQQPGNATGAPTRTGDAAGAPAVDGALAIAADSPATGFRDARRITGRQLWAAIPINLALQVIGTAHDVPDLLSLCLNNITLGDMDQEQMDRVFDKSAHKRFSKVLDLLQRLDLLHITSSAATPTANAETKAMQVLPSGAAGNAQHVTLYHAATLAFIDEPLPPDATPPGKAQAANAMDVGDTGKNTVAKGPGRRPAAKKRRTVGGNKAAPEAPDAGAAAAAPTRHTRSKAKGSAAAAVGDTAGGDVGQASGKDQDDDIQHAPPPQQQQQQGTDDAPDGEAVVGPDEEHASKDAEAAEMQELLNLEGDDGRPHEAGSGDADAAGGTGDDAQQQQQEGDGAKKQQTTAAAPCVRRAFDLTVQSGLDDYWSKLETIFGKSNSHPSAGRCFPATAAPEVTAVPLWSCLRARVSTVAWLQVVAAVHDMLGGSTDLDRDQLDRLAHTMGVDKSVVNRVVQEHLKRQLSAAGVRGKLSQHVRRAALRQGQPAGRVGRPPGRKPRRRKGAAATDGEEDDDREGAGALGGGTTRKRTRSNVRAERRARQQERRQTKAAAKQQARARELARLQSHHTLVLSNIQNNQHAMNVARAKLGSLQATQHMFSHEYVDAATKQQQAAALQQVTREIQLKEQEQKRLKEQVEKLRVMILQAQAAAAAPAEDDDNQDDAPGGNAKKKGKKRRGKGVDNASETDVGDSSDDDDDDDDQTEADDDDAVTDVDTEGVFTEGLDRSEAGDGDSEEGGEGGGQSRRARRPGAAPVRMSLARTFFTKAEDEALLRAWISLRVDKGMDYCTAAGRLPWMEMKGLPSHRKACYSRMALLNRKYRQHMDAIVADIKVKHAQLLEARIRELQTCVSQERKQQQQQIAGTKDTAGGGVGTQAGGEQAEAAGQQEPSSTAATAQEITGQEAEQKQQEIQKEKSQPPPPQQQQLAVLQHQGGDGEQEEDMVLKKLVDDIMRGPAAALLAALPDRAAQQGSAAAQPVSAPIRMLVTQQGNARRTALLATGLFGKGLSELTKQAREQGLPAPPAAQHHVNSIAARSSSLASGMADHGSLSPGALCAMQVICSLLVIQSHQHYNKGPASNTSASTIVPGGIGAAVATVGTSGVSTPAVAVHSKPAPGLGIGMGVAEGAHALAKRFSEQDLRSALMALRMGGWLTSGVGGTNAWQLSPQFQNHLQGNVEVRKASQLSQGAQVIASMLVRYMLRDKRNPQVQHTQRGVPEAGAQKENAMDVDGQEPEATVSRDSDTSAVTHQNKQPQDVLQDLDESSTALIPAIEEQLVDLSPHLIPPPTQLAPGKPNSMRDICDRRHGSTGTSAAEGSQSDDHDHDHDPAGDQPSGSDRKLLFHVTDPEAEVPSELVMVVLPALAVNSLQLTVQSVQSTQDTSLDSMAAAASAGNAQAPQVTLALSGGNILDTPQDDVLLQSGSRVGLAAGNADGSHVAVAAAGTQVMGPQASTETQEQRNQGQDQQVEDTAKLAHALEQDPWFALSSAYTGGSALLQGGASCSYIVGQHPDMRSQAEALYEQHLQHMVQHAQGQGWIDAPSAELCSKACKQVLAAVRSTTVQGVAIPALHMVFSILSGDVERGIRDVTDPALPQALMNYSNSSAHVDRSCAYVKEACLIVACMFRAGLVRVIAAYDTTRIAAVEHSQHLVVASSKGWAPSNAQQFKTVVDNATATPNTDTGAAAASGSGQQPQQVMHEVLIAPWHDVKGRLNKFYLQSLVQRAVLAVDRSPGMTEQHLVEALNVISPCYAKLLIRELAAQGFLRAECVVQDVKPSYRPKLLMGSVAMRHNAMTQVEGVTAGRTEQKTLRHYLPVLLAGLPNKAAQLHMPSLR